jgi:hypothetical protein
MKYDFNKIIDKDYILSKVSQEEIFEKYLLIKPEINIPFTNPLREDNNPDCYFYWNNSNPSMLKFKDFSTGSNWDCFNVVQHKYNLNFRDCLYLIAEDFNLKNKKINRELLEKQRLIQLSLFNKKTEIQIKHRYWTKQDMKYWNQYFINLDILKLYNVYPVEYSWLNGNINYKYSPDDPCYAYHLGNNDFKLYFPFRKKGLTRFLQSSSKRLQGYLQLDIEGEFIVYTKSMKDVMTLRLFGINSISTMSETIILSDKAYNHLNKRFDKHFTLFDNDKAGKIMSIKMRNKYNTTPLLFKNNEEKDFSDNLKRYGYQYMIDYIEEVKNKLL